jgi:alpha-L-arabinofuranosidase
LNFCIKNSNISKDIIQRCILITILFFLNFNAKSQEKKNFSSARPAMQGYPGFFLDDWKEKKNPKISINDIEIKVDEVATTFAISDVKNPITKISKYVFGNNLGHWSNRKFLDNDDFIFNLKDMGIQVVRFPGGNASNDYFWDAANLNQCPEGTPSIIYKSNFKKSTPPKLGIQGNFRTRPEDYYELLLRTKSTGSICVNYSFSLYSEIDDELERVNNAADYAASWVYEVNIKRGLDIKFWEIGNENWGKWQAGYNVKERGIIDPKKYGQHCKIFIKKMKAVDPSIKIGVVGFQKPKTRDPVQLKWNELVIPEIIDDADFYILHDYYTKFGAILSPAEMLSSIDTTYSHIKVVNDVIKKFTDKNINHLPIALTEFNTRSNASISKNDGATNVSHTAGLFFAHALGEIIRQGYGMAMVWDIENGYKDGHDHGMFASNKEIDVNWLTPHPSYYHYYYYNKCFGDQYHETLTTNNSIRIHTSSFSSGEVGLVVVNISDKEEIVEIEMKNFNNEKTAGVYEIYNDNPLSRKTGINGVFTKSNAGGPEKFRKIKANRLSINNNKIKIRSKPFSANYILTQ